MGGCLLDREKRVGFPFFIIAAANFHLQSLSSFAENPQRSCIAAQSTRMV
jgi:hypothetical protein